MSRHTKLTKANIGDNYGTLAETPERNCLNKKQNPHRGTLRRWRQRNFPTLADSRRQ